MLFKNEFTHVEDGYGVDVSSIRRDDLDENCLNYLKSFAKNKQPTALDLGCGLGTVSLKMAELGAKVTMFELSNMPEKNIIRAIAEKRVSKDNIIFREKSFANITTDDMPENLDVLYSHRALHYLPYNNIKKTLSTVFNSMANGAAAFLSVAKYNTVLSKGYTASNESIEKRFGYLKKRNAKYTNIQQPITLFHKEEFKELLQAIGFKDIQINEPENKNGMGFHISASTMKMT